MARSFCFGHGLKGCTTASYAQASHEEKKRRMTSIVCESTELNFVSCTCFRHAVEKLWWQRRSGCLRAQEIEHCEIRRVKKPFNDVLYRF